MADENVNALDGYKCPNEKCGSEGPFHIVVEVLALVSDEGAEEYHSPSWDEDAYCRCDQCDHAGLVGDFCPSMVPDPDTIERKG